MNIDDTGRFDLAARRAYADAQARVSAGTMAQLHRRRHAVPPAGAVRWRPPAAAFVAAGPRAGLGIGCAGRRRAASPPVAQATVPAAAVIPASRRCSTTSTRTRVLRLARLARCRPARDGVSHVRRVPPAPVSRPVARPRPAGRMGQSQGPRLPAARMGRSHRAAAELLLAPVRQRWNASPPEKRQHMLEHARRWQSMTPEQREHARHGMRRWHDMPPEKRRQARALFDHIRGLPEAERKAMLERWKTMTAAERKAWVDAHPPRDPAD